MSESLLPDGVEIVIGPDAARLQFRSEELAAAYRVMTLGDVEASEERRWVRISRYLWRTWKRVLGSDLWNWLTTLQEISRESKDPAIRLEHLAEEMGWSLRTTQNWIARYFDTAKHHSPGWQVFRQYVHIRPADNWHGPGSAPWKFILLDGDLLHAEQWEQLQATAQGFARQRSMLFEEPTMAPAGAAAETRVQVLPHVLPHVDTTCTKNLHPSDPESVGCPPVEGVRVQVLPQDMHEKVAPLPADSCAPAEGMPCHAMPMPCGGMTLEPGSENDPAAPPTDLRSHAAAALAARGFPEPDASWLLDHHPEAPLWALRWCEWIRCKGEMRNPHGFLAGQVRDACRGVKSAQVPPWGYAEFKAREEREAKERGRLRPAGLVRPVSTTIPPPAPTRLAPPPEIAELDARICAAAKAAGGMVASALAIGTAWQRDGPKLTFAAEGLMGSDLLKTFRKPLLRLVQTLEPEIQELDFIQPERS